jgi:hypothetical protein
MDLEKPLGQQLTESANGNPNAIEDGVSGFANSMGDSLNSAKESMGNTLNDFSNPEAVGTSSGSFLESNSMIAKFVFLILVVVGFVFILRIAIMIMGYFIQPDPNPYIFKGMLQGTKTKTISTNPTLTKNAVTILRSDDANSGLEFTWSVWLYIQDVDNATTIDYQNIFVKGDGSWDSATGMSKINNGPGMYLQNNKGLTAGTSDGLGTLHIVMDTVVNPGNAAGSVGQIQEIFDISNIPLNKWVHIALRQQNKIMDVYVNGTITMRNVFINIPKQNYNDIIVCGNGGFNGQISNLRYFSHALNVLELSSILAQGPNTKAIDSIEGPGTMQYLSMNWYSTRT